MSKWLDLDAAQQQLLALAPQMGPEEVPVDTALGRVLAHDLSANRTQPPADLSAMDGYAIAGHGPWALIGESRAGTPFDGALSPGQTVRISTGAHMPEGADSVLIQENAEREGEVISADEVPPAGRHVRKRGFDFGVGDALMQAGTMLGPAQIALAMAGGHGSVSVTKPPRIAVLDSGDELAKDPAQCRDDQIPASNSAMIASMLAPLTGLPDRIGPVPDDMTALGEALGRAQECDILITSGGASVGDHDLIQDALREWGADIAFWKVAIKPGKPLMVATRMVGDRRQVILGLPGNPVSSFVTAFLFALPLVRAALGMPTPLPRPYSMAAGEVFAEVGPRREFVRGVSDGQTVVSAISQDSSALASLARANCLIEREPNAAKVEAGEAVRVYNLQSGGFPGV